MPVAAFIPEATSGIMPILLYIGWIALFNAGSFDAKTATPNMQERPPIIKVFVAPIVLARLPARRLPNGAVPINAIV